MTTATPHTPHHGGDTRPSLNRTAFSATVHCLTGCAIGEILGMVLSPPLGFASDPLSIATMELFDTLIILIVPGAMNAGLDERLFWARSPPRYSSPSGPRSG